MFKKAQKRTDYWSRIRKKAPKVPDITCPDLDYVLDKLEKRMGKNLTKTQFKLIEKKIERLRKANEQLRESGVYWHDTCKETVRDLLGKKKSR
jgi:FtsZ-binding cell division protein ZapB